MKKFILTLVSATFASIAMIAQPTSEHLTFKGVPIDGTLAQYVTNMKDAGFEYLGEQHNIALLKGQFAGFNDCIIRISELTLTNIVGSVDVILPKYDDSHSITGDYEKFKSMLTEKYGEPAIVKEDLLTLKFSNTAVNNIDSFYQKKLNKYIWYTTFKVPKGEIILSIQNDERQSYLVLRYFDKINSDIARSAAMEDL